MAADSFIIIDEPAVTDKKLDTYQLTVGANTVERERFMIAGEGATDIVKPVAHDAVDAGSPLPIGGYASAATPTAVSADGDRVRAWFTVNGAQHVADGGGSLTVDNGGTFAVQATVAAAATNIAKAEDVASADADVGVPALAVRKATPANTSGTDGDYEFLQMSAGRLWVDPSGVTLTVGSHAVTNAGTFAVQDTSYTEDAAAPADPQGPVVNLVRKDTPAATVSADGDLITLRGSNFGAAYVTLVDNAGAFLSVGGGTQYTEDAVAAADPVGNAINLVRKDTPATTVSADGDNIALRGSNYGAAYVTMLDSSGNFITGSTQYTEDAAAAADPLGDMLMAVRRDTLSTSEVSADGDNIALKANSKGCLHVDAGQGVAHDAADAGNGGKITGKAETSPKGITTVADGDRTDLYADSDGMLMVKLNTSFGDLLSERVTDTGGSSTAFTNFSAVASTRNYVTAITVYNSSATAGTVDFRDGTGGSVLWTMPIPAGGGSTIAAAFPLFRTTANTALAYDVSGALTTVTISVSGFQSKV